MRISALIADWDALVRHLATQTLVLSEVDSQWIHADSFTKLNDSASWNWEVGEAFLAIEEGLTKGETELLSGFLVPFCTSIAREGVIMPPQDLDEPPEWIFSAMSPSEVRRRLAMLEDVDLAKVFRLTAEHFRKQNADDMSPADLQSNLSWFFLLWAAAFGQAAGKGWGLLVVIG